MSAGATATVDASALAELRASFAGALIAPGHPGYEAGRMIWNGSIDRRPALIARCAGAADVATAIRFARRTGLPLAVRSGGHSYPGHSVCDDGVVIDLGSMTAVRVDPEARTARVQAGALWGDVDRATQAFGLATTGGIVSHTGVAGLTLGGGLGWLHRKHGLTIDQLLSVDLVTAAGERVTASHDSNPDLFWGLRGGGGNFGVATEFRFRLHPVGPTVLAGPILWPIARARDVLRFYRRWCAEAPDELMTLVVQRKAPPFPAIPSELHGELVIAVVCCYAGTVDDGERVLRPLRAFGRPALDLCVPKPYVEHQTTFDGAFPHGWRYYFRACDLGELTDEAIDVLVDHGRRIVSPITSAAFFQMGGAVARVPDADTAFSGRGAGFTVNINGNSTTDEGFAAEREWVHELSAALRPHRRGVYVNFLMEEGRDRVREAYGEARYARLQALKRAWDPDNLFRLNQNIPPD